jgi:hypothetical protein
MNFKHAEAPGWYYQIDQTGKKSQSFTAKNKPGLYQEMQAWVAAGNEIEPLYTAEELAAKEAAEAVQALEAQKQNIIALVKSAEYHFIANSRHPDTDGKWAEWVAELWAIYDGEVVKELPDKPY